MWQFCHFLFHPIGWFFWGSAGIGDNLGDGIITNFGDNLCDDFATICFTQYGDFFVDLPEMVRINFISLRQPTKRGKLFKYLVQFLVWESQSSRSSTQKLWGCGGQIWVVREVEFNSKAGITDANATILRVDKWPAKQTEKKAASVPSLHQNFHRVGQVEWPHRGWSLHGVKDRPSIFMFSFFDNHWCNKWMSAISTIST